MGKWQWPPNSDTGGSNCEEDLGDLIIWNGIAGICICLGQMT